MKKLLSIFLCLLSISVFGQVYNPTIHTVTNKALGVAQASPADARVMYFDPLNFIYRPFQNTTEVKTYLPLSKYRWGNAIYIVDSAGTLNSDGTYTGGVNTFWMFKDGTADNQLVELNLFGGGSGNCSGCLLATNNLNDVANTVTARSNLGLGTMAVQSTTAAGDLTGTWPNITVARFNGQLPAFYLNYNNLFNTPTIPAQLNPTCVGCTISGTFPNLTWTVTGSGFNTAGVDLIALSSSTIGIDTQRYRKMDTLYSVNDSTINYLLNGSTYTIQIRGGRGAGGGSGTGTVTTVSVVTANGVSGTVTNPTSTPAITLTLGNITPTTVNGLTFTALATGFTVQGGTTSKTLTVPLNATVSNVNTGDITVAGETYGTLSAQVLTFNAVNVSGTNITGVLKASAFPAETGDVTNSVGSLTMTIANNAVTNAKAAQMAQHTFKGNNTGVTANAIDLTATQLTAELNVATTLLKGLVPAPGTATGKVLSDAMTWIANGTGNPNTKIGSGFWWVDGSTNQVKTAVAGLGTTIDSLVSGTLRFKVDTTIIQYRGLDSVFLQNVGSGFSLGFSNLDTFKIKKLFAGSNVIFTQNNDSSITISATGGASGGVQGVGLINSVTTSSNGLVISGTTIFAQYASPTVPGMVAASGPQTLGATLTFSAPFTVSTFTTAGGTMYTDGSGLIHQTGVSTTVQVLHGGVTPSFFPLNYATDGSGILGIPNGGNGTATPVINGSANVNVTGSWGNYTISTVGLGTVTSVGVSGGLTGLTTSGGPITSSGTITIAGILNTIAGGSGLGSLSPYAVMLGGSTATGPMQQVSGNGTALQVLTSNGPGVMPTWQTFASPTPSLTATQIAYGNGSNVMTSSVGLKFTSGTADLFIGTSSSFGIQIRQNFNASSLTISDFNHFSAASLPSNTALFGGGSGNFGISGVDNSGFGTSSLGNILAGHDNAAFGYGTYSSLTSGSFNVAVGASAGSLVSTGSDNLIIGAIKVANAVTTTTNRVILIGNDSLTGNTIASNLIFVGHAYTTLRDNTATFGQKNQYIRFGNGGGNTAAMTAVSTPVGGDVFYNTDSTAYCMYDGTKWIKWGGSSGTGGAQTFEQVLTTGASLTTNHNIFYGSTTFQFTGSGTNPVIFNNGIRVFGFTQTAGAVTANYVMVTGDDALEVDATTANITISLPSSPGGTGVTYMVKKIDATLNTVTVNVVGGGNIDGVTTYVIRNQGDAAMFVGSALTTGAYTIYSKAATASGTYTPTITNSLNVSASTAQPCTWTRINNIVTVYGSVTFTPTSSGLSCILGISLPIAAPGISAVTDLNGVTGGPIGSGSGGNFILADVTNKRASYSTGTAGTTSSSTNLFTFSYIVK